MAFHFHPSLPQLHACESENNVRAQAPFLKAFLVFNGSKQIAMNKDMRQRKEVPCQQS